MKKYRSILVSLFLFSSAVIADVEKTVTIKPTDIDENGNVKLTLNVNLDAFKQELIPVTQPKQPIETSSTAIFNWTNKVFAPALFDADIAENMPAATVDEPHIPLGLAKQFDISYVGALRPVAEGESNSNYAVGTLAINPARNSILLAGHAHHNAVAEFLIPDQLSKSTEPADIPEPLVLQPYTRMLDRAIAGKETNKITGMLIVGDKLLVNSEIWYDTSDNRDNLQVFNASDFTEQPIGMLQLEGGARAAGYMSPIPTEFQRKLGGKYLTGWASNYSITSRYSQGPSLFVFDPQDAINADITNKRLINTVPKLVYPFGPETELVKDGSSTVLDKMDPVWSGLANARYGFIVPHTKLFLVVGSQGGLHAGAGYKITQDTGKLCGGGCTRIAADSYNYFWLFDVDDILSADAPWDVRPISYGKWQMPFPGKVLGAAFEPAKSRLYITIDGAGKIGKYGANPLVIAYKIKAKGDA